MKNSIKFDEAMLVAVQMEIIVSCTNMRNVAILLNDYENVMRNTYAIIDSICHMKEKKV